MSKKNTTKNYINHKNDRIRLVLKRLYEDGNIKKSDILRLSGLSRPKLDNVMNGNSPIDVLILLAINELIEEKINWFDLEGLENRNYTAITKEETTLNEPSINEYNLNEMKESDKEMLNALRLITNQLSEMKKDVDELKQSV